jgi:hypothetical protein
MKQRLVDVHHFLGHCMYGLGLATCATGFQDMQSSDLAAADAAVYTVLNGTLESEYPNGHDDANGDTGYLPNSTLAQLSSAGAVLLVTLGIVTYAALRFLPKTPSQLPPGPDEDCDDDASVEMRKRLCENAGNADHEIKE